MRYLSIFLLLSLTTAFANEVYFSRDENGNVTFSDKPSANSEVHQIKDIPTMPALVIPEKTESKASTQEDLFEYTSLSIISPADDHAVPTGHAGNLKISGVLSPGLRATDTIYLLDQNNVIHKGRSTSFSLTNLSRGEHKFQLVVRDQKGKELISSNPVIVHVQRASVLRRQ